MKNELIGKGFSELTADESTSVRGGSIFSDVLDIIASVFKDKSNVLSVLDIVEQIAAPIYALFGLNFRSSKA
ncbi:MAG: hypothetical protein LBS84_00400 [Clostridiales bacterium]|jgi:hypothetical protein|nr:hypothetical protein [Clostridiales bacterium]